MVCRTVLVDIPLVLLVDPSLGHLVLLTSRSRELICAHVQLFPIFIWNGIKSFVSGFSLSLRCAQKNLANFLEQENAAVWFKNVISHSFNLLARSLKISFSAFSMN